MSTHDDLHHLALPGLDALPREADPARDLWPEIEARMSGRNAVPLRREKPPRHPSLLRIAAAVLLFVGGLAVGRQWGRSSASSSTVPEIRTETEMEMKEVSRLRILRRVMPAGRFQYEGCTGPAAAPTTVMALPMAASDRDPVAGIPAIGTAALRRVPPGDCPEGFPRTGDLGIETLLCVGGSCSVNLMPGQGTIHRFSTEPRIGGLTSGGPADGKLRKGDILLAIDGVPVATREGGRRLANLKPGEAVTLRLRRDGREMQVRVVPGIGCNLPRLAIVADPVR